MIFFFHQKESNISMQYSVTSVPQTRPPPQAFVQPPVAFGPGRQPATPTWKPTVQYVVPVRVGVRGTVPLNRSALSLFKTQMCRGWASTGTCNYGEKCHFAHAWGMEKMRERERLRSLYPGASGPEGTRSRQRWVVLEVITKGHTS